jgi:hypothetical protein
MTAMLAIGVALGALLRGGAVPASPAQAQLVGPNTVYTLSNDGFLTTSNQEGDRVFLWYFEREVDRAKSQIYFVSQAGVGNPSLGR